MAYTSLSFVFPFFSTSSLPPPHTVCVCVPLCLRCVYATPCNTADMSVEEDNNDDSEGKGRGITLSLIPPPVATAEAFVWVTVSLCRWWIEAKGAFSSFLFV